MIINAVILAGGMGSRLFPLSLPERPKQFLDLTGSGKTLLQETAARAMSFTLPENILTVGNRTHEFLLKTQLAEIDPVLGNNIILEDRALNTAYSVWAALEVVDNGVVVVMPSDHFISGAFNKDIRRAAEIVSRDGSVVTLGIRPTRPDTNYGYVLDTIFAEKPNEEIAKKLIARGALWNSGIFVFDANMMRNEYRIFSPEISEPLSFDKAIMEKTDMMQVLPASFEWSDLGSFESLSKFPCYDSLVEPILRQLEKHKEAV